MRSVKIPTMGLSALYSQWPHSSTAVAALPIPINTLLELLFSAAAGSGVERIVGKPLSQPKLSAATGLSGGEEFGHPPDNTLQCLERPDHHLDRGDLVVVIPMDHVDTLDDEPVDVSAELQNR